MNKHDLLSEVRQLLVRKQAELQAMADDLSRGIAEDTKSSAGDKYETSRAMSQQELDKIGMQQQEIQRQLALLPPLFEAAVSETIRNGSLATTDNGLFFIGLPAGQVKLNGETVFCLGPVAPIAQKLIGLRKNDRFSLNGRDYTVLEVN